MCEQWLIPSIATCPASDEHGRFLDTGLVTDTHLRLASCLAHELWDTFFIVVCRFGFNELLLMHELCPLTFWEHVQSTNQVPSRIQHKFLWQPAFLHNGQQTGYLLSLRTCPLCWLLSRKSVKRYCMPRTNSTVFVDRSSSSSLIFPHPQVSFQGKVAALLIPKEMLIWWTKSELRWTRSIKWTKGELIFANCNLSKSDVKVI